MSVASLKRGADHADAPDGHPRAVPRAFPSMTVTDVAQRSGSLSLIARLRHYLPSGTTLPQTEFDRRHRLLSGLLWLHVPGLFLFALLQGIAPGHSLLEALVVAVPAALSRWVFTARKQSAVLVAFGLITASAVTVHLADGYIEAHFHFFVMIVALTLYEDWLAFGIAAAYVLLHHGLMGAVLPETVYNHAQAVAHPWRWAAVHASAVGAAGGFAVISWRFSEDARERQRQALERTRVAEARATAAAADLERSNADLERFAYVASHDLSEPLRTISSFLTLLERRQGDRIDDEGREFIGFAVDGSRRMQTMIDDLLRFSRAGRDELSLRVIDLEGLTDEVLQLLRARLEESGARVEVRPMPAVRADRGHATQVLQNLLANAIKFAGDDPPVVRVSAERAGGMVAIAVEDEGIGVPPAKRDHVFETFARLHGRDEYPGSGIGLSVCRRIVERHGGDIRIETPATGRGTRVVFTLPAA